MFTRYALFYTPSGPFARHGAGWLGWDIDTAEEVESPDVPGYDIAGLTQTPRKYGFHATVKAPFALADDAEEDAFIAASQELCSRLEPLNLGGLEVATLGRFLAFVPIGEQTGLRAFASEVVRTLDHFRAPLSEDELVRRRKGHLTPEQDRNLLRWGYPHVMEQYRFHMTLTGRMPREELVNMKHRAERYFACCLPAPFIIDALTLVGERPDGKWVTIQRLPLA